MTPERLKEIREQIKASKPWDDLGFYRDSIVELLNAVSSMMPATSEELEKFGREYNNYLSYCIDDDPYDFPEWLVFNRGYKRVLISPPPGGQTA